MHRVYVAQYSAEPILSEDGSRPRMLAEPLLVDGKRVSGLGVPRAWRADGGDDPDRAVGGRSSGAPPGRAGATKPMGVSKKSRMLAARDEKHVVSRAPPLLFDECKRPLPAPVAVGSAGGAWAVRRVLARLAWFPPAADIEPCVRFSRTRLPDVLRRWHSASRSPWPVGSWRDDGSVEVDQPEPVRRLVGDCLPAVSPAALVALGDEPREAVQRVVADLVELSG
jgi:hypothetical protein